MPTFKQKLAYKKIVENGGNISKGMKEAGYSNATAKTPAKLTDSNGWNELVENYLDDDKLLKLHKKLLRYNPKSETSNNPRIALNALDLAYKVKGKYKYKLSDQMTIFEKYRQMSDQDLLQIIHELEQP